MEIILIIMGGGFLFVGTLLCHEMIEKLEGIRFELREANRERLEDIRKELRLVNILKIMKQELEPFEGAVRQYEKYSKVKGKE